MLTIKKLWQNVMKLETHTYKTWKNHMWNYVSCHFLNVDGQIDPSFAIVFAILHCRLCW
jgi:hypothetical protein